CELYWTDLMRPAPAIIGIKSALHACLDEYRTCPISHLYGHFGAVRLLLWQNGLGFSTRSFQHQIQCYREASHVNLLTLVFRTSCAASGAASFYRSRREGKTQVCAFRSFANCSIAF